jgi:hypothetical protein
MKYETSLKLEKVCAAKNTRRYNITDAHLDAESSKLVATNGGSMVVLPVEVEPGDVSGPVPVAAIAHARKHKALGIKLNGAAETAGLTVERTDRGRFPDYKAVLQALSTDTYTVSLNARQLFDLAQAIGYDIVRLDIPRGGLSALRVTVNPVKGGQDFGAVGVLMPCRLREVQPWTT